MIFSTFGRRYNLGNFIQRTRRLKSHHVVPQKRFTDISIAIVFKPIVNI